MWVLGAGLTAHGGRPCPARLPTGEGVGFGPVDPAPDDPGLPRFDRAWVCRYTARDGQGEVHGAPRQEWVRDLPAAAVPTAELPALADLLAQVHSRPAPQACTADPGWRWLLVTADEGDLTGLAVDDFGCRDVRLTDDPFTVPVGESRSPGVVAGTLAGPPELVSSLVSWAGVPGRDRP